MKKDKLTIEIPCKSIIERGKIKLFEMLTGEMWFQSSRLGKKLKNEDGNIVVTNKGAIDSVFLYPKNGEAHVSINVSLKDLKKLVKKAEEMDKYWKSRNKKRKKEKLPTIKSSYVHLNPEVSFLVKYK